MTNIRFEWDEDKNRSNRRKHGVTFEDASRIFDDPLRSSQLDRIVDGEERWLTVGAVAGIILLAVAHTIRDETDESGVYETVRIISARRATPRDRKLYGQNG